MKIICPLFCILQTIEIKELKSVTWWKTMIPKQWMLLKERGVAFSVGTFFTHWKAYSYCWPWGCVGFIQQPVDLMSIFYVKEEFLSINVTCECATDEILPHHPCNNLLLHEELSELQRSECLFPASLSDCLWVVLLRCEPLLLLSLKGSLELFLSFLATTALLGRASSVQAEHPDCVLKSRRMGDVKQLKNLKIFLTSIAAFIDRCAYAYIICLSAY